MQQGVFFYVDTFFVELIYNSLMSFLAPFIKALLISILLFFILVFLGMKYHWIGSSHNDETIKLNIPKNTVTLGPKEMSKYSQNINSLSVTHAEDSIFEPQIIQTVRPSSLVVNMTKAQVVKSCTELLKNQSKNTELLEIAIGNCVISNYQESIINTKNEESRIRSTKNRQAQLIKTNILKACQQSLGTTEYSNEIERQLLLGICMSEKSD